MKARLGGHLWKIYGEEPPIPCVDGWNDPNKREILIDPGLTGVGLLDVVIHEALHAEMPFLVEDTVDKAGERLAKLLKDLGAEIRPPPPRP